MASTSTAVSTPAQDGDRWIASGPPPGPLRRAHLAGADRLVGEEPPQVLAHRLGRLVPRLGFLLDRLQDDRLQVPRNAGDRGPGACGGSSVLICSISLSRSDESNAGRSVSSS